MLWFVCDRGDRVPTRPTSVGPLGCRFIWRWIFARGLGQYDGRPGCDHVHSESADGMTLTREGDGRETLSALVTDSLSSHHLLRMYYGAVDGVQFCAGAD